MMDSALPGNAPRDLSPILVGRNRERRQFHDLLHAAMQGRGHTVLVGGEAGIGKTTLTQNLGQTAAEEGVIVLTGHCYDLTVTSPYGPWVEILSAYNQQGTLPKLPEELSDETGLRGLPGQDALFRHMLGLFREASAQTSLLLILEDVHWADSSSLDLLRFLARSITDLRLLLVVTYRNDELTRDHPLYQMMPNLLRESPAVRFNLHPLNTAAIRELIALRYSLADTDVDRLVHYLEALAEGNPFFLNELLRTLEEEALLYADAAGWQLKELDRVQVPTLIQQVIEKRLARIDGESRRLLEMAAVIGQEVPLTLWQTASGVAEGTLSYVVERAMEVHVLEETGSGSGLRFTHALVREALYRSIVLPRRRMLHRDIATVLASSPGADPSAIAYHFRNADDDRALTWLIRSGERAQAIYAPRAAVEHLSQAIDLANQASSTVPLHAYRTRGLAYTTIGDFELAREDYETVLAMARTADDRQAQWQALIDLGVLWAERDYARTGAYFREALELAREIGDQSTLAYSLNWVGNWHVNTEQPLEAVQYHEEALTLFRDIDDHRGIAVTLDLLGMAHMINGNLIEAAARYQQAIDLFRELGDRRGESSPLANLVLCGTSYTAELEVPATENPRTSTDSGERAVRIASEIGWYAGEAYGVSSLAARLGACGDYTRATELAQHSLAIAEEVEHRQWMTLAHGVLGMVYLDMFALDMAQEHLERAVTLANEIGSLLNARITSGALARTYVLQREFSRAEATLDDALGSEVHAQTIGQRRCWYGRAELALARGDPDRTIQIVEWLVGSTHHLTGDRGVPLLSKLRGEALLELGHLEEAERHLRTARRDATRAGYRSLLWRVDLAQGRVFQARGRETDAAQAFASARSIIGELADAVPGEELRDNFVRRTAMLFPADSPPSSENAADQTASGLTTRELEVLKLVVDGLTDSQIAEELYRSPRTVNAHLRSIYNKLGVSSRVAATRVAIERELV